MKFITLLSAFFMLGFVPLSAQWSRILDGEGGEINTLIRTTSGKLMAGTNNGLFTSTDDGTQWESDARIPPTWKVIAGKAYGNEGYILSVQRLGSGLYRTMLSRGPGFNQPVALPSATKYTTGKASVFQFNNAIFVGVGDALVRSDNNGYDWSAAFFKTDGLRASAGDNGLVAIACRDNINQAYRLRISRNKGANWSEPVLPGASSSAHAVEVFVKGTRVVVAFNNGDVFVSNDQAMTWTKGQFPSSPKGYDPVQLEWNDVYNRLEACVAGLFVTSPDGGVTWTAPGTTVLPGVQDFASAGDQVFAGTLNGLFKQDAPSNPFQPNGAGIQAAKTSVIKVFGTDIFAGFQHDLYRGSINDDAWLPLQIPLLQGADRPEIIDLEKSGNVVYLLTSKGLIVSLDNGLTWGNFYTVASSADKLLNGAPGELWYKNGPSVKVLNKNSPSQLLRVFSASFSNPADEASDFIYLPTDGSILALGYQTGRVYVSTDGGSTWNVRGTVALSTSSAVRFFRATSGRLFITTPANGIYYSDNDGSTWVAATLPANQKEAVHMTQSPTLGLFATTTSKGILRSTNNGATWAFIANNLSDFSVTALTSVLDKSVPKILVGIENRGIWKYDPAIAAPFALQSGPTIACPGSQWNYCTNTLPLNYACTWAISPSGLIENNHGTNKASTMIQDQGGAQCSNITFINSGIQQIAVTYDGNGWPMPATMSFQVNVKPIPVTQLPTITVAYEDLPFQEPLNGTPVKNYPGTYTFQQTLVSFLGCDSVIKQQVIVKPPVPGTIIGAGIWENSGGTTPPPFIVSTSSGLFVNSDQLGWFTLTGLVPGDTIWANAGISGTVTVPAFFVYQAGVWSGYTFRFVPTSPGYDLRLTLTNHIVFRPGFKTNISLNLRNNGQTTAPNTQVKMVLPASLSIDSIAPTPTNIIGDTLVWNFGNLSFDATAKALIVVKTDVSVPIGTQLQILAWATPVVADNNPTDNAFILAATTFGSFDPNDKQVTPTYVTPAMLANKQPFEYTIRFQNTGTFPAEFVTILDTLASNVDPSTFRLIASSHPCTWKMTGHGVVEFLFKNIDLPDSLSDESGSHGFVQFSIQPRSNLALGARVRNTADIVFDFNAPIRTNTAGTQVVAFLPNSGFTFADHLLIKPNPAAIRIFCRWNTPAPATGILRLFSLDGLPVREVPVAMGDTEVNVELQGVLPGLYIAWLEAGYLSLVKKVVVVNLPPVGILGF